MFPQFQTRLSVLRWLLSFVTQSKLASVGSSFPAYFLLESIRRRRRKRSPAVLHLAVQEWCQGMFDLKSRVAALSSKATTAKYQPFRVTIRVLTCTFYYQEAVRADSCKLSHQCILWSWECGCVRGKLYARIPNLVLFKSNYVWHCRVSPYAQNTALPFSLPLMVSIIVPGFLQFGRVITFNLY